MNRSDAPTSYDKTGGGRSLPMINTLPDDEVFHFMRASWNVTAAREIVADRATARADIKGWFGWLSMVHIPEQDVEDAIQHEPLIFVRLSDYDKDEEPEPFLIGGWANVARARREGVTVLPVHVLTDAESRQVIVRWEGSTDIRDIVRASEKA